MQTVTEPLPDEHRHFADPLEAIRQAAEGVGDLPLPELRRQMDDVHTFLVERFIPHARADEEAIYPSFERVLDAPPATEPMVRDHAEMSRLAAKLLALRERWCTATSARPGPAPVASRAAVRPPRAHRAAFG